MKNFKMIALLVAAVVLTFSACKKDDDPLNVEFSTVVLSADNETVTVTFNQGVYRNADKTGNLDASNFTLAFTASDTITASYTAQHTAGQSEAIITITYTDPPEGGETLHLTAKANTIYGTEGNVLGQDLTTSLDVH